MANEIYHRSNWGNAVNDIAWGDTYEKFDATNEMFVRSDNYENSNETDKLMAAINPKPSILLTPTAYDNGSLHSVKPVKTFGSEIVVNGNYETDSDWSKGTGCTIENGKANLLNAAAFGFALSQTPSFIVGRKYLVEYSILQHTTGSIRVRLGSNLGTTRNGNGTFTETIVAQANSIIFQPTSIFTGSIDNVSAKEIIDADFDFTRGSSATRVNEQGLIEDVQILSGELVQNGNFEQIGSELVTNGDFDTDSDWTLGNGWSISGGKAILVDGLDPTYQIYQSISGLNTKNLKVTFDVTDFSGDAELRYPFRKNITGNGSYTFYGIGTLDRVQFQVKSGFTASFSIDNVSVKEVGQNWAFGTGWSMGDGKAIFNGFSNQSLAQDGIVANNKKYKLTYTISNYVQGGINWRFGTSSNLTTVRSANGTYVEEITSTGSDFRGISSGASELSIDNVSLIEITDDTDLPRIDYTDATGSLLLEPQSTNLLPYSEDLSQLSTATSGFGTVTETANFSEAPNGKNEATRLQMSSVSGYALKGYTIPSFNDYFYVSVYLKSNTTENQEVAIYGRNSVTQSYTVTPKWQRFEVACDGRSASSFFYFGARTSYGSDADIDILAWGVQAEQGTYATSYIPTNGSAVTRDADVCNNAGSSDLINSTEGVLYAEIAALADDLTFRQISISDGTNDNRVRINYTSTSQQIQSRVVVSGVNQANINKSNFTDITDLTKIALSYKQNEVKFYINGELIGTDTSATMPTADTFNVLNLDSGSGTGDFYGKVKCVAVFKEALTDEELTALTT